jgi:hypothetical protein
VSGTSLVPVRRGLTRPATFGCAASTPALNWGSISAPWSNIRSLVNEGHLTAVSVEFLAAALLAHFPDDDGPLQVDDLSAVEIATASLQLINWSTAYCAVPVGRAR